MSEIAELAPSELQPQPSSGWRRRLPPFTPRQWRVFGIVTTAGYFDNYDRALLSLALKQIQRGLNIAEGELGRLLSLVRLGYLFSLIVSPLADRYGRRRLLLHTVVGYTLATGLSAVAPEKWSFVAFQVAARAFAAAEAAVGLVILAEEVSAGVRGWAIGLWGALTVTGWGMAAMVFSLIDVIPFGWRGLYALALIPLAIVIPLRRALPETQRFEKAGIATLDANWLSPLLALLRDYTARISMLAAVSFISGIGTYSVGFFTSKYLQEAHGWTPARVSSLVVIGGAIGILGNVVAGRLSDQLGRRSMGAAFMFLAGLTALLFYNSAGAVLVIAWIAQLFFDSASATILNAYGAELFPTSSRSTSSAALTATGTLGGALGLFAEAALFGLSHSHWRSISYLTIVWMLAPIIMVMTFPETAGRELEVTSSQS